MIKYNTLFRATQSLSYLLILLLLTTPLWAIESDSDEADKQASIDAARSLELTRVLERLDRSKAQFALSGTVEQARNQDFSINGESFEVNSDTKIIGDLKAGRSAEVRGFLKADRSKVAHQIVVFEKTKANSTRRAMSEQNDSNKLGQGR